MFNKEKKVENNILPKISTRVIVENKNDYYEYIKELKNENIKYIHFIEEDNNKFFISNPNNANFNIKKDNEILNLKNKVAIQQSILSHFKEKNINNNHLKIFVYLFVSVMYKIIKSKYLYTEKLTIKDILETYLNFNEEINKYNAYMEDKIEDYTINHIRDMNYELNFLEILKDIRKELLFINHSDINIEEKLKERSIDIYEVNDYYKNIITNYIYKTQTEELFNIKLIKDQKEKEKKYIIFDDIPKNIFKNPATLAQLRALGIYIIFPVLPDDVINDILKDNTKEYIIKKEV